MNWHKNLIYKGADGRQSTFDALLPALNHSFPLIILAPGYKGFKDWGCWDLVGESFIKEGFGFVKFNFSHAGGTVENPIDFPDEEAFAKNTYSKELDDVSRLLDQLSVHPVLAKANIDWEQIGLIGHSRGGGIAILAASQDERIKALATWAAVADFAERFAFDLDEWERKGVMYVKNARTGQDLPHNFTWYTDFQENRGRLDIPQHARKVNVPWLIAHGTRDPNVAPENAERLKHWNPAAQLEWIEQTAHTFGSKHPWNKDELPEAMADLTSRTISFFRQAFGN